MLSISYSVNDTETKFKETKGIEQRKISDVTAYWTDISNCPTDNRTTRKSYWEFLPKVWFIVSSSLLQQKSTMKQLTCPITVRWI